MRKQTKNITIRLTPNDYIIMQNKVKKSGLTQAEYLRQAVLNTRIISTSGIVSIMPEFARIGNNINQIAKKCNQGYLPTLEEIKKQSLELNKIFGEIRNFIRGKSAEAKISFSSKRQMEETIINLIEKYSSGSDNYGDN